MIRVFSMFLVIATLGQAQQPETEKPYLVVRTIGAPGRASAGVVFARKQPIGQLSFKGETTVVAPDGRQWDLGTPDGFLRFTRLLINNNSSIWRVLIAPGGDVKDVTTGPEILKTTDVSIPFNTESELVWTKLLGDGSPAGKIPDGQKDGKLTAKGRVKGTVGIGWEEGSVQQLLLPVDGILSATGTIEISISGPEKRKEKQAITGAVLGMWNGKLSLGLEASTEAGQKLTYVAPLIELVGPGQYTGKVFARPDFGFNNSFSITGVIDLTGR